MGLVLIADDEPELLECFSEVVEELGHRCLTASDGEEALELARLRRPDLIISDYMMPGRDGVSVIRELREIDALAHVPVILVSASFPRGLDEAWRFLPKPIDRQYFERCIAEGLRVSRKRGNSYSPAPLAAPAAPMAALSAKS